MADATWRDRLRAALKDQGFSMRSASLAAGMGPGYVFSILSENKDPTIENLVKICEAIGVPLTKVIFADGASAEREELLALFAGANPATRRGILEILRAHKDA